MEILAALLFISVCVWLFRRLIKFNADLDRLNAEAKQTIIEDNSRKAIEEKLRNIDNICNPIIEIHKKILAREYKTKIRKDKYGVEDRSEWEREVNYFINRVITPHIDLSDELDRQYVARIIDTEVEFEAVNLPPIVDVTALTPLDFEHWCSRELENAGWAVETTKASGDQGADVIGRKGMVTLVLQCKLYSSPVGNKAVQEAFAARAHYGANIAGVVTNADYTRSAQGLADTTGVLLLHHSELVSIDERITSATVLRGSAHS